MLLIARFLFPLMQRVLLEIRDINHALYVIDQEYDVEERVDAENSDRLFLSKIKKKYDFLIVFSQKDFIENKELLRHILDCIIQTQAKLTSLLKKEPTDLITWQCAELMKLQACLLWLFVVSSTEFKEGALPLIDHVIYLMKNGKDIIFNDSEIRSQLQLILLKIAKKYKSFFQEHTDFFEQFIPLISDDHSSLRQMYRSWEAHHRRAIRAAEKSRYLSAASSSGSDEEDGIKLSPVAEHEKSGDQLALEQRDQIISRTTEKFTAIELRTPTEKFWKRLNQERNKRYAITPRSLAANERTQEIRRVFANHLREGEAFLDITQRIFISDSHYIAVLRMDNAPARLDTTVEERMHKSFKQAEISRAGNSIQYEDGEYRIHPFGDQRIHARVVEQELTDGSSVTLLIFDQFRNHVDYEHGKFYSMTSFAPKYSTVALMERQRNQGSDPCIR